MVFTGNIFKSGSFWVVDVPSFEISTQGRSKKEAFEMIADAIQCHVDHPGFKIIITPVEKKMRFSKTETFTVASNNESELISLFLKRQRQLNKLTVRQVAKKLGYASPSAYAQYETGKHIPGLEKISKFIAAMNPKAHFAFEIVMA